MAIHRGRSVPASRLSCWMVTRDGEEMTQYKCPECGSTLVAIICSQKYAANSGEYITSTVRILDGDAPAECMEDGCDWTGTRDELEWGEDL